MLVPLVMAALPFFPAWTLDHWQARLFLAVFGISGLAIALNLSTLIETLASQDLTPGEGLPSLILMAI